ncbi:UNVERIFIED_CONTAM: hypothetical protein FKN15_013938 [Acipenser sinensis]
MTRKSKKREKCRNNQMFPLTETQYCPCDKYNAQPVGNWSDCILPDGKVEGILGMKVLGDIKECGQGYRSQAMVCYDQNNRIVETSRCNSHGYIEEACIIPCPSDCKLSEWSNWSRCSKSCGSGVKVRSKWLREKPYNGGRPCPKLDHVNQVYEVVPCHSDCSQYVWAAEPWSVWRVSYVDLKENCGEGVQTRKVRCMQNTIDGPSDPVEDYLCDPEDMPLGARESKLPCPEDCVLSDWAPWSRCPLPCSGTSTRERSAYPIRHPGEGRDCPSFTETEACSLNKNCYHYTYNVTDWSTCQLSEKAVCGNGIKTRMLDCVRSDGKSVDLEYCKELGLQTNWQMNMSCVVECPVNCQLSDWAAWSECSESCGLLGDCYLTDWTEWSPCQLSCVNGEVLDFGAVQVRSRAVIAQEQDNQQQCPEQMWESRPCADGECYEYKWMTSSWRGSSRSVWCQRSDGLNVTGCSTADRGPEFPGGGAQLAECRPGVGLRSARLSLAHRTPATPVVWLDACGLACKLPRAALSSDFFVSHTDGECYEYKWMTSSWRGSSRSVWCQRSDGLNVTGGCPLTSQPVSDRSCDPPCNKPQSYCTELGVCGCEVGFTEVMTSDGMLDQCTLIPVLEMPTVGDKKADVKTSRAINPTQPSTNQPGPGGRTWFLQPFGQDGKLKTWVYGVAAGAFVLLIFIVSMIYLACKKPKKPQRRQNNRLKPLTLAYDGDADM